MTTSKTSELKKEIEEVLKGETFDEQIGAVIDFNEHQLKIMEYRERKAQLAQLLSDKTCFLEMIDKCKFSIQDERLMDVADVQELKQEIEKEFS